MIEKGKNPSKYEECIRKDQFFPFRLEIAKNHLTYAKIGILTIISMQLSRIGMENTVDINSPLLSKYC